MHINDYLKFSRKLDFLVIGGVARSGTRMIADILNQHPNIVVESEMHAKTIEAYFDFLETVQGNFDHYSERKGFALDKHWKNAQRALHHAFFATAGKLPDKPPFPKGNMTVHALKTPGYERYFDRFEAIMHPVKPKYIYAIRPVGAVWRSWVTRNFGATFEDFEIRYRRSLRQALTIRNAAPNRFALFDLAAYIEADDKKVFVEKTITTPLGIDGTIVWPEEGMANTNSASALGLQLAEGDEVKEQMAMLERNEKIAALKAKLFA